MSDKSNPDPLWNTAAAALNRDVVGVIYKHVNTLRRSMHPINHPAIQGFRTHMKTFEPQQMSAEFELPFEGKTYTVNVSRPQSNITVSLAGVATFNWRRMSANDNGVFIYAGVTEAEERLFYGVLATVLTRNTTIGINVDDIVVRFEPKSPKGMFPFDDATPVPLRERIDKVFYAKVLPGGSATKKENTERTYTERFNTERFYKGRVYTVHTGVRGGHYIIVQGRKMYV
jgi:hypothetical protein